jgi:hypothetical protein
MDLKPQTSVSLALGKSIYLIKVLFWAPTLFFGMTIGYGQESSNVHIEEAGFKNKILSVLVKDSISFCEKYSRKLNVVPSKRVPNHFYVSVGKESNLDVLRHDKNILFIDLKRTPHTEGSFDLVNPAINKFNIVRRDFPTLNGSNLNVSIKEESFERNDLDLIGRSFTTSASPAITSQHATIMAVLVAGAGNSSPLTLGIANQATLTSSNFNELMPDDNAIFINNNVFVQNHSYGVGIENYYGLEALAYDQQVDELPQLLHVFSSGNAGNSKPTSGPYTNLTAANLTGTFKQSKNTLTVTALDTTLAVNASNSRGPAFDGRLKPELTAYGPAGTSEAAALTTGTALLIQEKYLAMQGKLPDAAMIKAILIASADDIGATGIDFITGYGNLNASQALSIVNTTQTIETTITSNTQKTFPIYVPSGTRQIRLAVSWTDPAATINSTTALVNDIDSYLDDGTTQYRPWVLSSIPIMDSLQKAAKRKVDNLNNVEFITIDNPTAGTYTLNLSTGALQTGEQKVAIAYFINQQPEFTWAFPVSTDILKAESNHLLGWTAHTTSTGNLHYRVLDGLWQSIGPADVTKKFKWKPPNVFSKVQLKMELNGYEYLSDEFTVSPQLEIKTEFICADSLLISWRSLPQPTQYKVYTMGAQYLQEIETTSDTVKVLRNPANPYFAVKPVLGASEGLTSTTINYTQQGALCYLNLFEVQRISADAVQMHVSLGSLYKIQGVNILKKNGENSSTIASLLPNQLEIVFTDEDLIAGKSEYWVEVVLQSGVKILSQPVPIIIEKAGAAVLWPNPVTNDDYLKIISSGKGELRLTNSMGQILFSKNLTLLEDELDLNGLMPGLYLYQILDETGVTSTGRIIKL